MPMTRAKKNRGRRACLGDNVQIIAKMGVFCSFSEGSMGQVLQNLA